MADLVLLHHNEPMTTSLAIAEGTENTHQAIMKMVRTYVGPLQEFGEVGFQIRLNPKGSPTEFAFLNEPQSTLLITFLRNSEIVVRFKVALVKAFYELRDRLHASTPQFITGNLAHGADLAVAADRTFRSFLRAGRSAGLTLPQALRMADRQTAERTGMNMLAELGVDVPEASAAAGVADSVFRFVDDWLAGRLPGPPCVCRNSDLYAAYVRWCHAGGRSPLRDAAFHPALLKTGHGVQKRHVAHGSYRTRATIPPGAAAAVNGEKGQYYEASMARFAAALSDWS